MPILRRVGRQSLSPMATVAKLARYFPHHSRRQPSLLSFGYWADRSQESALLLLGETVAVIDTKEPSDHESLHLSNILAYEERGNGEIVLYRTGLVSDPNAHDDSYLYRIAP
jgi:hypothetical protein